MHSYDINTDALLKAGKIKGASFAKAVKEIKSYIADPSVGIQKISIDDPFSSVFLKIFSSFPSPRQKERN